MNVPVAKQSVNVSVAVCTIQCQLYSVKSLSQSALVFVKVLVSAVSVHRSAVLKPASQLKSVL